jgi:ferritin-like metal-binding protein YciE
MLFPSLTQGMARMNGINSYHDLLLVEMQYLQEDDIVLVNTLPGLHAQIASTSLKRALHQYVRILNVEKHALDQELERLGKKKRYRAKCASTTGILDELAAFLSVPSEPLVKDTLIAQSILKLQEYHMRIFIFLAKLANQIDEAQTFNFFMSMLKKTEEEHTLLMSLVDDETIMTDIETGWVHR